jgi:transmembrane sensor
MDYSILNKYLAGEATGTEVREVFNWIGSAPENRKEFIQYKKIWALTSNSGENPDRAWSELQPVLPGRSGKERHLVNYLAIAASVMLILCLGIMFRYIFSQKSLMQFSYQADMTIEVPPGQMSNIRLPDGTAVHLNSGTKLIYPSNFNSGERTVFLEGEAFFDVSEDLRHPFLVKAGALSFKVYGTSFNIQAYADDQEINATLVEGSLGIMDQTGKELSRIVPGENASFRDEKLVISQVKLDLYTSWKDGLITFRNEKLKDIARKMERWYNVEIIILNDRLGEETYLGTIMKNKPVDQILEIFALTSSLRYKMIPRADKPTLIYWE